jgi:hypothetical protein
LRPLYEVNLPGLRLHYEVNLQEFLPHCEVNPRWLIPRLKVSLPHSVVQIGASPRGLIFTTKIVHLEVTATTVVNPRAWIHIPEISHRGLIPSTAPSLH